MTPREINQSNAQKHEYWCDNSPIWSHYGNASSILFPAWERAFAEIVKSYLPKVTDESLKQRMVQFIKEEISHANAHESFNDRHNLKDMEEAEFQKTKIIMRKPQIKFWLGTMVSIEHLAACMSRSVLTRWGGREGKDYKLFCWHSKEELGHKSLAIDLWNHLGYTKQELNKIAKVNQLYVMKFLMGYTIKNTYKDGQFKNPKVVFDLIHWLGFVSFRVLLPMLKIYLPKFHPENVDDNKYLQVAI